MSSGGSSMSSGGALHSTGILSGLVVFFSEDRCIFPLNIVNTAPANRARALLVKCTFSRECWGLLSGFIPPVVDTAPVSWSATCFNTFP